MRLKFRLSNGKKTFFQWDVNQKIILENPICTQVHFENKDISDKAYVKEVYKDDAGRSVVDIPDIFLQYTPGFLFYGYVISEDGKKRYTDERGDVSVIRRAKPSDYVFTPEDQKTLEEVFDDAVKYVPEERTDEEKANARENIEAEFKGNKVDAIGDDADGKHYPSVKAVKDYIRDSAVQADLYEQNLSSLSYVKNGLFELEWTEKKGTVFGRYDGDSVILGVPIPNDNAHYLQFQLSIPIDSNTYDSVVVDATAESVKKAMEDWSTKYAITVISVSQSGSRKTVLYRTPNNSSRINIYICGAVVKSEINPIFLPRPDATSTYNAGIFMARAMIPDEDYNNFAPCRYLYENGGDVRRLDKFPTLYSEKEIKTYNKFNFNEGALYTITKLSPSYTKGTGTASAGLNLTEEDFPVMSYLISYYYQQERPVATFYIETITSKKFKATYRFTESVWKEVVNISSIKQSDWYEFDKTSPAYIKSKPFEDDVVDITGSISNDKSTLYLTELQDRNNKYLYYVDGKYSDDETILSENGLSVKKGYSGTISVVTKSSTSVIDLNNVRVYRINSTTAIPWRYLPLGVTNLRNSQRVDGYSYYKGIFSAARWQITDSPTSVNLKPCYYYEFDDSYSLWVEKDICTYDEFNFNGKLLCKGSKDLLTPCYTSGLGNACTELGITEDDLPIMSYLTDYSSGSPPSGTYYIETATNKRFIARYRYGTTTWSYIKKLSSGSSGDSSAFYINVTSTTDSSGNTTYSADKTADEIIAAYESGAVMIGVCGEFYMQGVVHIANPNELTLIFAVQELNPINGEITQRQCSVHINKDNKEMQVLYGVATKILDKGIVFMVNNNTVQTSPNSGSFDEILQTINSSMSLSKSINIILAKDRAVYNLSRLEGNSNGILIKFDDVANSKTYIVFGDSHNKAFTYSEEPLSTSVNITYNEETGNLQIGG